MQAAYDSHAERSPYLVFALRLVRIAFPASLMVVLIYLTFGRVALSESYRILFRSFLYAASIAAPASFLYDYVSRRFTDHPPVLILLVQTSALAFLAVIGCLIAGLVLQLTGSVKAEQFWYQFRSTVLLAILITVVYGLSLMVRERLQRSLQNTQLEARTRQRDWERASKLLAEAKLASLEARVHPHFLFNTLNSIASLIPRDSKRAEQMVQRLASLLRFSLNAGAQSMVPLGQEIKIVQDYLEIERVRFGARLDYNLCVPDSLARYELPALTIQSLVENCVKHAIAPLPEGGRISIVGMEMEDAVRFDVIDTGPGFSLESVSPGHGLDNLINRLDILFGPVATLEVLREQDHTVVRLLLPRHLAKPGGNHGDESSLLPR